MAQNKISVLIDVAVDKASASLKNFRQDIAKAEGATGKMKVGWGAASTAISANAGALAASAGAALVSFGVKAVNAFQETALAARDFSNATGVAVEDSSRLIEVAGDFGIEATAIESAILKMNKAVGDGKPVFEQYGVEIAKTDSGLVDANATFINAITTIGAIQDPTKRAQAAQQAFGKSYGEVARFMEMSAGELQQALADVSDQQAISDEEAKRAEKFDLAMDSLQDTLTGVTMGIGGALVPALTDFAEGLAGVDKAAADLGLGGIGGILETAYNTTGLADVVKAVGDVTDVLGLNADESEAAAQSAAALESAARKAGISSEEAGARVEYYASRVAAAAAETATSTRTEEEANEAREEAERLTKAVTTAVDARRKAEQDLRNEMLSAIDKNYAYRVAVDDAEEALSEYNEAIDKGKLSTEELDDATRETGRQLYETAGAYAESKGAVQGSQGAIDLMIESLYTQMSTLAPNSPLRLELLAYITELGKIPTDIETKMRIRRVGDVGFDRGDIPDQFANGTPPGGAPGGVALVGERGPELVHLPKGAQVYTASETSQMLGGASSVSGMSSGGITVNIYPKALPTDRELIDLVNSVRRRNGNVI